MPTRAYAAQSATTPLAPCIVERRAPGPHDVEIAIDFCGVCHSDLHTARGEWDGVKFPSVPGYEVGRVTRVGDHVTKFKTGDRVGVGCLIDSCLACSECEADLEQVCLGRGDMQIWVSFDARRDCAQILHAPDRA
jgi:uncharacterized zinc-type alcohol dehydrogenase-like protein